MISENNYESADFPDAYETSPSNFNIVTDNSYISAINNAMEKHLNEVKEKQDPAIIVQSHWKRKYVEFLNTKNSKILEFLTSKLKTHPVLGQVEVFFQKFGKYNINKNTLKDIILDLSANNAGLSISDEVDALLLSKEFESSEKYVNQTQFMMEEYKLIVDKILDQENLLKIKLSLLDSLNQKIVGIQNLSHNEHYEELMSTTQKYLNKAFDDNNIESEYTNIIELYRKFYHYREILKTVRINELTEKEPLCTICFNEQIQYALVPCGHTFCSNCVKRQMMNCCICRGQIRDSIKIYFT